MVRALFVRGRCAGVGGEGWWVDVRCGVWGVFSLSRLSGRASPSLLRGGEGRASISLWCGISLPSERERTSPPLRGEEGRASTSLWTMRCTCVACARVREGRGGGWLWGVELGVVWCVVCGGNLGESLTVL
jgi:hypothetical protein